MTWNQLDRRITLSQELEGNYGKRQFKTPRNPERAWIYPSRAARPEPTHSWRFYVGRVVGGDGHHRRADRHSVAGARPRPRDGAPDGLSLEPAHAGAGHADVRAGLSRPAAEFQSAKYGARLQCRELCSRVLEPRLREIPAHLLLPF